MSLDLGPAIRKGILDPADPAAKPESDAIRALLAEWQGEPCVFAYRPVPDDAGEPLMIINPDASIGDEDGLTSDRPVVIRDIAIYGPKGAPGDPADKSPQVETLGYMIRRLFHRRKFSVQPEGYSVTDVVASGPIVAPVDDDATVGRLVSLTIRLRRNP